MGLLDGAELAERSRADLEVGTKKKGIVMWGRAAPSSGTKKELGLGQLQKSISEICRDNT